MIALLLAPSPALACDHVEVAAPGVSVTVDGCDDEAPVAVLVPAAPPAEEVEEDEEDEAPDEDEREDDARGQVLLAQYGMQLLPDAPGHQLSLRLVGEHDAYVGGELRYTPGSDVAGVGRVGAGLDLAGGGGFDLTLGLFVGGAGEWESDLDATRLWGAPILGTEIGLGLEGRRLFAKYRWLGGIGGGPLDELLTENELVFGYKVTPGIHLLGQYVVLDPGADDPRSGVGLGLRLAL